MAKWKQEEEKTIWIFPTLKEGDGGYLCAIQIENNLCMFYEIIEFLSCGKFV